MATNTDRDDTDRDTGRDIERDGEPVTGQGVDQQKGGGPAWHLHCVDAEGQDSAGVVEVTDRGLVLDVPPGALFSSLGDVEALVQAVTEGHHLLVGLHVADTGNPHRTRGGHRPHRSHR